MVTVKDKTLSMIDYEFETPRLQPECWFSGNTITHHSLTHPLSLHWNCLRQSLQTRMQNLCSTQKVPIASHPPTPSEEWEIFHVEYIIDTCNCGVHFRSDWSGMICILICVCHQIHMQYTETLWVKIWKQQKCSLPKWSIYSYTGFGLTQWNLSSATTFGQRLRAGGCLVEVAAWAGFTALHYLQWEPTFDKWSLLTGWFVLARLLPAWNCEYIHVCGCDLHVTIYMVSQIFCSA